MTCQHPGACRCPDITQIFKHKACQARKPPIPSCASWASAAVMLNLTQLTRIITCQIYIRCARRKKTKVYRCFRCVCNQFPTTSPSNHIHLDSMSTVCAMYFTMHLVYSNCVPLRLHPWLSTTHFDSRHHIHPVDQLHPQSHKIYIYW